MPSSLTIEYNPTPNNMKVNLLQKEGEINHKLNYITESPLSPNIILFLESNSVSSDSTPCLEKLDIYLTLESKTKNWSVIFKVGAWM